MGKNFSTKYSSSSAKMPTTIIKHIFLRLGLHFGSVVLDFEVQYAVNYYVKLTTAFALSGQHAAYKSCVCHSCYGLHSGCIKWGGLVKAKHRNDKGENSKRSQTIPTAKCNVPRRRISFSKVCQI